MNKTQDTKKAKTVWWNPEISEEGFNSLVIGILVVGGIIGLFYWDITSHSAHQAAESKVRHLAYHNGTLLCPGTVETLLGVDPEIHCQDGRVITILTGTLEEKIVPIDQDLRNLQQIAIPSVKTTEANHRKTRAAAKAKQDEDDTAVFSGLSILLR